MRQGWWSRFLPSGSASSNASASTTASGEAFDEVHLPPGASADDEPISGSSNAADGDKKKNKGGKGDKSSEKSGEDADDKAREGDEDDTKTDDAIVIVVDDGDTDGDEDDPDEDDPETDDKNKSGGKSGSRGKKDAPMKDEKKNESPASGTEATTPASPANTAGDHPVLKAALAAGIDTEAKFGALQASAKVGDTALASARSDAKAAAVAHFGQAQPDKITAAEALVDGTNDLTQLNLLTEQWHAGAPGGSRVQGANGSGKRQTRSNAPTAPTANTEKKPAADASTGGAPSSGNVYAQYNKSSK